MLAFVSLVACTQDQIQAIPADEIDECHVDSSTGLAASDPGTIGISADEVIALLDGASVDVDFARTVDELATTSFASEFTLAVSLAGDVEQQERTPLVTDDGSCISGTVGYATVDISLASADAWTVGPPETPPTITWRGAEGEIWIDLATGAEVAQWLADDVAANFDCTSGGYMPDATGGQTFRMGFVNEASHPWVDGPVLIAVDCEVGPVGTIFQASDLF